MTTQEHVRPVVEKLFPHFESYEEEALMDGIQISLNEAFDQEKSTEERITALTTYLAMQYFLQGRRLRGATDSLEKDNQLKLVERFSKVFVEESDLLGLYNYCNDNARRYFEKRRLVLWGKWRNLADAIRDEISAEITND